MPKHVALKSETEKQLVSALLIQQVNFRINTSRKDIESHSVIILYSYNKLTTTCKPSFEIFPGFEKPTIITMKAVSINNI